MAAVGEPHQQILVGLVGRAVDVGKADTRAEAERQFRGDLVIGREIGDPFVRARDGLVVEGRDALRFAAGDAELVVDIISPVQGRGVDLALEEIPDIDARVGQLLIALIETERQPRPLMLVNRIGIIIGAVLVGIAGIKKESGPENNIEIIAVDRGLVAFDKIDKGGDMRIEITDLVLRNEDIIVVSFPHDQAEIKG